jgi:hypothetical protein
LGAAAVVQQYLQIGPRSHRHQNQRYHPVQHGPDPAKAQLHCSIKSHTTHTNWAHSEREETSGATTACTSSAPFLPNLSSLYLTSPVPSPGLSSTYNYNWDCMITLAMHKCSNSKIKVIDIESKDPTMSKKEETIHPWKRRRI